MMNTFQLVKMLDGVNMSDSEKIKRIQYIIDMAEDWCKIQLMPQDLIMLSAMKDIRHIVKKK